MSNQHFWNQIYGWSLALGFILLVIIVIATCVFIDSRKFRNPFAPFIRAFERRQEHLHRMKELKLRAQLARSGMDPEYVTFMEKKMEKKLLHDLSRVSTLKPLYLGEQLLVLLPQLLVRPGGLPQPVQGLL